MMFAYSSSSVADKLPKSAKPLTTDEVKAIYSGKSVVWSKTNAFYFSPDGVTKGYNGSYYIDGKWEVKDNIMCMMNQGVDSKTKETDGKTYTDCNTWFKDAKGRLWDIWSTRYDGSKPPKNDYNRDTDKKFKNGDTIDAKYGKLKG